MDPREDRLPKWARDELAGLRRRVADAERSAEEARLATKPDESDAILDNYSRTPIGLGKGTRVRFLVNGAKPETLRDYVDVRVDRWGSLEVHSGVGMLIEPQVTNLVRVKIPKRGD